MVRKLVKSNNITEIINTKSSKVVISKFCIRNLGLVSNNKVDFSISSAINSKKKPYKLFY